MVKKKKKKAMPCNLKKRGGSGSTDLSNPKDRKATAAAMLREF